VSETNNIDVFGNLKDFLGGLTERQVAQELERLEQIRSTMPTPAQSAYIGTLFAPGSGVADVAGELPSFPTADVPLEDFLAGEPLPSLPANIEEGRYLDAFLQSLGAAGDALYATPAVGPLLGATVKGIAAIPPVAKGLTKPAAKGIEGLRQQKIQEDVQQFARDKSRNLYDSLDSTDALDYAQTNQTSYVSPTLEALIAKAPPDLKGEQISNWLKANTDKGVKPKELELLDLDSYIMQNPNATVRDVAEYGSQNKVQLVTRVIASEDAPTIDFEVSTPDFDPLDPTYKNYQPILDDLPYELANDQYTLAQFYSYFLDDVPKRFYDPSGVTSRALQARKIEFEDYLNKNNLTYDEALDRFAKYQYNDNPYELVEIKSTGYVDANIPDETFAFGNEDTGYSLFVGGEKVTDPDNIAYSRTEAQIQLRDKLSEYGDPLRIEGEEDYFGGGAQYKQYIDENLPGGSDYREYVINWGNAPESHGVTNHFEDTQQISSVLARERKLEDGTSSLHIDEMQSDLHTQGSKQGYRLPDAEFNRIKQEIDPLLEGTSFAFRRHAADGQPGLAFAREGDIDGFLDFQTFDMYASRSPEKRKEMFILDPNYDVNKYKYDGNRGKQLLAELGGDREKFNKFVDTIKPLISEGKVPNYPFKDDWHNMTLKNMVLQAIEEGKDSVSVSTSYAMKTRYSDKYDSFYETLYDKKIPSAMKKLANKYGGKFEKGKLDFDDTFEISINPPDEDALDTNILRITPEMKQKILEEGMPSFAYGGPVNKFIGPNDINVFSD
jgi:tetrahydromethanopterin S-methyltransferase subunit F